MRGKQGEERGESLHSAEIFATQISLVFPCREWRGIEKLCSPKHSSTKFVHGSIKTNHNFVYYRTCSLHGSSSLWHLKNCRWIFGCMKLKGKILVIFREAKITPCIFRCCRIKTSGMLVCRKWFHLGQISFKSIL